METKPKIIVYKYQNVALEYEAINAWKEHEKFPYKQATDKEHEYLKSIDVIEVAISREYETGISFDALFEVCDRLVSEFVVTLTNNTFICISDFKMWKVGRLRSYKGILPKDFKGLGIQKEVFFSDDYSLFTGIIKVAKENISLSLRYFTDGKAGFMINTLKDILTENDIEDITRKCMVHDSTSVVNFIALLNHFNHPDDLLFRMGGDGGSRYVSFQIFCQKPKTDFILNKLAAIQNPLGLSVR